MTYSYPFIQINCDTSAATSECWPLNGLRHCSEAKIRYWWPHPLSLGNPCGWTTLVFTSNKHCMIIMTVTRVEWDELVVIGGDGGRMGGPPHNPSIRPFLPACNTHLLELDHIECIKSKNYSCAIKERVLYEVKNRPPRRPKFTLGWEFFFRIFYTQNHHFHDNHPTNPLEWVDSNHFFVIIPKHSFFHSTLTR